LRSTAGGVVGPLSPLPTLCLEPAVPPIVPVEPAAARRTPADSLTGRGRDSLAVVVVTALLPQREPGVDLVRLETEMRDISTRNRRDISISWVAAGRQHQHANN